MASAGPNTAGTGADDATVGTVAWTNPGNVTASDNVYATNSAAANKTSHYLKATNFGFTIPAGATINGVVVEWEIKANNGNATDNSIKLVKGGTITGNDRVSGTVPTTEAFVSYGGSTDLWGLTLTASDINASTFGAVYSFETATSGLSSIVSVDSCQITVYYTLPATSAGFFSLMK